MEDAQLSNVIYSHPEDRNAHNSGKIITCLTKLIMLSRILYFAVFGGYLMRQVRNGLIIIYDSKYCIVICDDVFFS